MRFALRAAAMAAVLATSGLGAGAAAAAPPLDYDHDIISQYSSANSVETIRHLAVDIGPRRSGTPQEREGAEYLKSILDGLGFQTQIYSYPVKHEPERPGRPPHRRPGQLAQRHADQRPALAVQLVAQRQADRRRQPGHPRRRLRRHGCRGR